MAIEQETEFHIDKIFPIAREYFKRSSGLHCKTIKYKRIWDRAIRVFESLSDSISVKAIYKAWIPADLRANTLLIDGHSFVCNAFEIFSLINIKRCYVYILTAGPMDITFDALVDQLYADIWGTSLVDAGRDLLKNHIAELESKFAEDFILTQSFGPGYYGMDISELKKFFQILDPSKIGVSLLPGGMMVPQKSCAGIYFSVRDSKELPPSECEYCIGSSFGCNYCNISY